MIPEDWMILSYSQVFDFLATATYSRDQVSNSGDYLYVHYGDIHTKWRHFLDVDRSILPAVSKDQAKRYPLLKEGDLIVADVSEDYGGVGASVEVQNLRDRKAISGLHTFLLRDRSPCIVPGLRGYISSNPLVRRQFDRLTTGIKVYGVSRHNLKSVCIPLPSMQEEQSAIASALSDINKLTEKLEKLIAKKQAIKTGAMQQLLTPPNRPEHKRLLGFAGKWKTFTLNRLSKIQAGINKPASAMGSGVLYVTVQDLYSGSFIQADRLGRIKLSPNEVTANRLEPNDIVFGKSSVKREGIGYPSIFLGYDESVIPSGFTFRARAYTKVADPIFLFHTLRFERTRRWLVNASQASALTNINQKIAESIPIPLPPTIEEQVAIATVLSEIDTEIEALESRLTKMKFLKQGMMSELLTGRTRLV